MTKHDKSIWVSCDLFPLSWADSTVQNHVMANIMAEAVKDRAVVQAYGNGLW